MKKIIAGLMVITIFIVPMQLAFAKNNDILDSVSSTKNIESIKTDFEEMFKFDNSRIISLKGITNKMLIEFDSQENALYRIKNKCTRILDEIKKKYSLDDLSEANWKDYYGGLYSIINDAGDALGISEADYEYRFLRAFFDIYENKYKNDKIVELSSMNLYSRVTDDGEEKYVSEVIANNLPYRSKFSKEYFDNLDEYVDNTFESDKKIEEKNNLELRAAINVEPAVDYASKYATSPNTNNYHYFHRGDCTNFVSQILEASGVRQVVYDSVHSGWWHKYNPNAWLNKHTHSRSWTMADTFARYMGVILTRTNHRDFSANVSRGSIIASDWTDDGEWDHIAFITAAENYVGSYGYYDYRVAQHTNDYHLWTSNSNNGWENIGSDGGRYGRIRD